MNKDKIITAPVNAVGAAEEQSINRMNIVKENESEDKISSTFFSFGELMDAELPRKKALVENFLYPGVYILAGDPKVGKSFLVLQLLYQVSRGEPMWNLEVRKGRCLYLAYEDGMQRLQDRTVKMFGADAMSNNLYFSTEAMKIDNGLETFISNFIDKDDSPCLIVVDTFQTTRNTVDCHYGSDYDDIRKLKELTVDKDVCIILVHHFRKEAADNSFDRISGTNGIFGAADGAIALTRSKDARTAYIEIRGRDQVEQRIEVVRNKNTLRWDYVKSDTEPLLEPLDPDIEKIISFVNPVNKKWKGTATELCETLNLLTSPYRLKLKLNCNAERLALNNITFEALKGAHDRLIKLSYYERRRVMRTIS